MNDTLHESLLHVQFNAPANLLIFEIILENHEPTDFRFTKNYPHYK